MKPTRITAVGALVAASGTAVPSAAAAGWKNGGQLAISAELFGRRNHRQLAVVERARRDAFATWNQACLALPLVAGSTLAPTAVAVLQGGSAVVTLQDSAGQAWPAMRSPSGVWTPRLPLTPDLVGDLKIGAVGNQAEAIWIDGGIVEASTFAP